MCKFRTVRKAVHGSQGARANKLLTFFKVGQRTSIYNCILLLTRQLNQPRIPADAREIPLLGKESSYLDGSLHAARDD